MESPALGRAIVISTGRCGSTLLSDLIAREPDTLSIQEFFAFVEPLPHCGEAPSGATYWAQLCTPRPELATLFRIGRAPNEVCYPAAGRWADNLVELPRVLAATLPKISPDPDLLLDTLAELVPAFPAQPVARHHRMLLDLLATLVGRRRWVERSGASSHHARFLLETFPDAKIVYLTRNWDDTARSMSRHPSFQLLQLSVEMLGRYGIDPFQVRPGEAVPAELVPYLPDRLTADALAERSQDIGLYRSMCAFLASEAEQAIADAAPRELLTMTYEDLVDDPVPQLARLGRFLGFADEQRWAHEVAGEVLPGPRRRDAAAVA